MTETILSDLTRGVETLIDRFHEETLTLPAPGTVNNPASWINPGNGRWAFVMPIYQALYAVVAVPMLVGGAWAIFGSDPHERRAETRRWAKNIALLVGGLIIVPLALHAGNIIAMGFAPSGDEFLSTPGNVARLTIGLTVGAALIALKAIVVIAAFLILQIQDLLIYFGVATYPASIWLLSTRNTFAQALGAGLIGMLAVLIGLKAAQSIFLRFLFELPLGFNAPGASVQTLVMTIIGVAIAFVAMPYYGTKKAIPAAVVTITGKMRTEGENWIDNHAGELPDRDTVVERVRGSGGGYDRARPGDRATESPTQARGTQQVTIKESVRRQSSRSTADADTESDT